MRTIIIDDGLKFFQSIEESQEIWIRINLKKLWKFYRVYWTDSLAPIPLPQFVSIVQQEKRIKDLEETYEELFFKKLKHTYSFANILSKYVQKDRMDVDDEQKIVEIIGITARGTIVSEDRFDKLYNSATHDESNIKEK